MTKGPDFVIVDATVATMVPSADDPYGLIEDGAVAIAADKIVAVGPRSELRGEREWSAGGRLLTPGLVECHTHLVFGGDRRTEFEHRCAGASYEEIAAAGGGILSTVTATRAASDDELVTGAVARLTRLVEGGVTTVEVKSGYGLDVGTERRMLDAARTAGTRVPVAVVPTLLALHALPPEYRQHRQHYVDLVCDELLPETAASAVDAFCDEIAFSAAEVDRLFTRARQLGMAVKLHADQLSDSGGAALAAKHGALSADHLEHASYKGIKAMADAATVAVLLPGATVTLQAGATPPVDALRAAGVPMAVSTDANPGSSPLLSLLVAAHLSCTVLGLTPAEAFAGVTTNAAAALGLGHDVGALQVGAFADIAVWDAAHPADLVYWCAGHEPTAVIYRGHLRERVRL